DQDQICFEHYMQIVNFVAEQISKNEKLLTFVDLGDFIETNKLFLDNSNIPIDYLKNYEKHQYIDLKSNNFSNIKIKILNDDIFINKQNFNKLIDKLINQNLENNNDLIQTSNNLFSTQLQLLTKVLYQYEEQNNNYLLNPNNFKQLIKTKESQLIGFLDKITTALIPKRRTEKNKEKAQQQIISLCYFLAGLHSQNINKFKTDLGLYLLSCELNITGIDFLIKIGITSNKDLQDAIEFIKQL
ncbi:9249_t:CDS:2, partial [Racocetra fulgida]